LDVGASSKHLDNPPVVLLLQFIAFACVQRDKEYHGVLPIDNRLGTSSMPRKEIFKSFEITRELVKLESSCKLALRVLDLQHRSDI
jgi:hypothetical protein